MTKEKLFSRNIKDYLDTFQFDKNFLKTVLLDWGLYTSLFVIINFWSFLAQKIIEPMNALDLESLQASMNTAQAEASLSLIQGFIIQFVLALLLLIIVVLAVYTLFKSNIWKSLVNKKFNWKYYGKATSLNLIWGDIALLLILFFTSAFTTNKILIFLLRIFIFIIVGLFFYLRSISFIILAKEDKFKNSLKIFKIAFKKWAIKPVIYIVITVVLLSIGSYLLGLLPTIVSLVISALLILMFWTWARVLIVKNLKIKKR